jgi:3-methyladenine DNA glycosylase AlkD
MTSQIFTDKLNKLRKSISQFGKKQIFALAKEYMKMPVEEVIKLLKNNDYNLRVGAVAILDWKARDKKITEHEKSEIYNAYIQNHIWIDDWGLVDRAAPYVIGGFLFDKDREPLYKLAKSRLPMERRTAIVSTYYFIRQNDVDETFKIAQVLVDDKDEYVQMAVGSWIREAGKKDLKQLIKFLDQYAPTMNRKCLRYAIEKLDNSTKEMYLKSNKTDASR